MSNKCEQEKERIALFLPSQNTTVANYIIISGAYNSKEFSNTLSFELINVPYDIEKELDSNTNNIEKESYEVEIKDGKYRDMEKIYRSFDLRGIDRNKV